jgi:branched-subunit amino acid ABC-type transport system permease component
VVIGVVTEWSTLVIDARWKTAVAFLVLVIVLIARPQGIFGRAKAI